jgi:hypothetical protein
MQCISRLAGFDTIKQEVYRKGTQELMERSTSREGLTTVRLDISIQLDGSLGITTSTPYQLYHNKNLQPDNLDKTQKSKGKCKTLTLHTTLPSFPPSYGGEKEARHYL